MTTKSDTVKAAEAINKMMEEMAKKNVSPDHLAFVMIASAHSMLIRNNPDNPLFVTNVLASAMQAAVASYVEEYHHDDDEGVRH